MRTGRVPMQRAGIGTSRGVRLAVTFLSISPVRRIITYGSGQAGSSRTTQMSDFGP